MECCDRPKVYPGYCRAHFTAYFEQKVKDTIEEFGLLKEGERVAVGCSGGKDSSTLLYLLKKFHSNVTAIAIDEGIEGYRDKSLEHLKEFCRENEIELMLYSFQEDFGKPLDGMEWKNVGGMPCTTCGTLRRYMLNNHTKDFDKIAVGHNMDDEAQSVLMNLFRANIDLMARQGPKTADADGFTQRIKPLYRMKEKEVATYAYLMGFVDDFVECPNAYMAYRIWLRDILNEYELKNPGTKENLVAQQLKLAPELEIKGGPVNCKSCGEPSSNETCQACRIRERV